MTPEGKVKKEIKAFLDSLGYECWYFMPSMMGYGRKGIPDIVGCYKGRFFAIEVKAPGKVLEVTPWQEQQIDEIENSSGFAIVTDDINHLKYWFSEILKTA